MTTEPVYRPSEGFVTRVIAGDILLVPVGAQTKLLNGMVTFTETGAFIWKHLDGKRDAAAIAQLLAAECGVDVDTVLPDVVEFLRRASAEGFITQV